MDVVVASESTGPQSPEISQKTWRQKYLTVICGVRLLIILALLGIITYVIIDSFTTKNVRRLLTEFLDWIEELGFGGAILFALVYMIATVMFIPGSVLTIGAGFVFTKTNGGNQVAGTFIATAVVFVGASVGSILAFIVARFLLRESVSKLTLKYPVFKAIDAAVEKNGFKILFLLRLSPLIPFNALNYILGITAASLRDYSLASFGLLPGTIGFCFIGSTLGSLTDVEDGSDEETGGAKATRIVVLVVGIIATIVAVVVLSIYAKRELKKHLPPSEEQDVSSPTEAQSESEDYQTFPQNDTTSRQ